MIHKYKELRDLSTDQLIKYHDRHAKNTIVGIQYYLDEIRRRDTEKANKTVLSISVITLIVASISLMVSIIAIFMNKG